jgi:hypothetical protein
MEIDFLGVGAATVVAMVIGALWYSPLLFVKPWLRAQGKDASCRDGENPAPAILNAMAMNLISALALSEVFRWRAVTGVEDALVTALLVAIGFVVSNQLMRDRFQGATLQLSLINAANTIVVFVAMGLVLAFV